MHQTVSVKSIFNSSLESAFKTPMLSDVCKVHSGHFIMPRVTHCLDDEDWGKPGGSRRVFMAKHFSFKGGEAALDTVIERRENEYWKIRIDDFKMPMMGINCFEGEWITRKISENKTEVIYKYTLYSNYSVLEPLLYWFTKTIWKNYMKHALQNIKVMAESGEPYLFE